ncbi:hypothetical protein MYAM1_003071 [Malassezia yamatoensis]|uniref:Restriction of telomere capping protein 4 n=1 Tax=Malassezia yamatoensis TaxID=253288 RepID=A0AAJ5YV32_9BASI|nr:hypothetical protein MYAM1_003071 [Malassezia yamatoensis]
MESGAYGSTPGSGLTSPDLTRKLFIPKKRDDVLSQQMLAELRKEFGASPESTRDPTASCPSPNASMNRCPFCKEPLPKPMSRELHTLMQQWMQKSQLGHTLRPTDTLAVCQRHRDEHDIIPEGKRLGWPDSLDFRELRRRITDPKQRYMQTLQDRLLNPEPSWFFQEARREREQLGKKVNAGAHQIHQIYNQQCGYFGEQGAEMFIDILYAAFIHDPLMPSLDLKHASVADKFQPLDAMQFIGMVLMPELVCMLIQDDMGGEAKVSFEKARSVQHNSGKFGVAMYPSESSDARKTRRASGSWIGAAPRSEKKTRRIPHDGKYIQQTLSGLRRSSRIPETERRTMLDLSDSDDDSFPTSYHQQRLPFASAAESKPRPVPRPAMRS